MISSKDAKAQIKRLACFSRSWNIDLLKRHKAAKKEETNYIRYPTSPEAGSRYPASPEAG